jgi:uncharacterized protein (DUF2252 family)
MNTVERILDFNRGRDPQRLALKYKLLASSPSAFFRGTAHLFYEDLTGAPKAPLVWVCGDAHLENFGVYKGDNRLVYFDFNDFDEAGLAPATWELVRMLTGVMVAHADAKPQDFLDHYAAELATGKPRWVERATSSGSVRKLVYSLKGRSRKEQLNRRTQIHNGIRSIRTDGKFALPLHDGEFDLLDELVSHEFQLVSAARRIAGNGSLGVGRYILLVNDNYLLDLKEARPSLLSRHLEQPHWASEAHRVVAIQRRMQAISPAFLDPVEFRGQPYVLRELVPREDRIRIERVSSLRQLLRTEACVMAWAQLRSSGRQGSAIADELIDFSQSADWRQGVLDCARHHAALIDAQFQEFRAAGL